MNFCNFIQQRLQADDFQIPPHRQAVSVGRNFMETSKIKSLSEYTLLTKELIDRVYTSNRTTYPWFRGHRNSDWLISPNINRGHNKYFHEREMVRDFKLNIHQFLKENTPQNELEWLFLMQHYGLPTRLTDWTESSLTALFFAVSDLDNTCDGRVFVIDPWQLNKVTLGEFHVPIPTHPKLANYIIGEPHEVTRKVGVKYPVALRPTRKTPRILAQKGTFIIFGSNIDDLETQINEINSATESDIYFVSFVIDKEFKLNIMKELFAAGISFSTIFPEVQGVCQELNFRYSENFVGKVDKAFLNFD